MTLEAKLKEIQDRLRHTPEHFRSEAAVRQGIVLPILRELNWDTDNTRVVCPEYFVSGKVKAKGFSKKNWADFALFDENSDNPKVFIEVKKLDAPADDGVEQVMSYAQIDKKGAEVDIAVRTDGRTWSFYLPFVEGRNQEKWVDKLDLLKLPPPSPSQESSEVLQRYLEKDRVVLGEAHETALVIFFLKKYRNENPSTWKERVDPAIAEFMHALNVLAPHIAKKTKSSQNNIEHDIVDYFRSLLRQEISPSPNDITGWRTQSESREHDFSVLQSSGASERKQPIHRRIRQDSPPPEPEAPPVRDLNVHVKGRGPDVLIKEIVIRGQHFPCSNQKGNQKEAMAIVFEKLQEEDQGFLQRFYKDSRNQRRRGGPRYLGRNQRELFGKNVERTRYEPIGRDWIISTNYGWEAPGKRSSKKKIIQLAADVAGLKLKFEEDISGKGIIVNLDD